MSDVTTTDLKHQLLKCDRCRNRVTILVPSTDNRRLCVDCLPPAHRRAVLGDAKAK